MKRTTLMMLCTISVSASPLTYFGIETLEKRLNCPTVYMTPQKEVIKVVDSSGKEIFPEDIKNLPHGYSVVWCSPDMK